MLGGKVVVTLRALLSIAPRRSSPAVEACGRPSWVLSRRTTSREPNDVARGLGKPLDPGDAAQVVVSGDQRRLDLLVDDAGGPVVNAVHLGIGARARGMQGVGAFATQVAQLLHPDHGIVMA